MTPVPCPRCGRAHGRPVPPDDDTFACASCGTVWRGRALPTWWPPRRADRMAESDRDAAEASLRERLGRLTVVVDAARDGVDAARAALDGLDAGAVAGPAPVPSDRVLLAEVLDAAILVCRAVGAWPETLVGPRGLREVTVDAALGRFDDASATWTDRGRVDFAAIPDDPGVLAQLAERARVTALVASGDGSEHPDPGPGWDDELSDAAETVLGPGPATGWARHVWSRLALPAPLTEPDRARARLRVHALGRIRGTALDLIAGGSGHAPRVLHDPGMPRPRIRALSAAEGIEVGPPDASIDPTWLHEGSALERLTRIEADRLGPGLLRALGVDGLLGSVWASRFSGARYPVAQAVLDEAVRGDGGTGVDAARRWIDAGMPLRP